jgi:hypothetical protein
MEYQVRGNLELRQAYDSEKPNGAYEEDVAGTLYANAQDALKKVVEEFSYWSGRLTETSLQMCYALIGANWVVFHSVNGILYSGWAKASLFMVLLALGTNVIGAWVLSESLKKRVDYAEEDADRWKDEFEATKGQRVAWPFTDSQEQLGIKTRRIKGAFTLGGAVCFIIGTIVQ